MKIELLTAEYSKEDIEGIIFYVNKNDGEPYFVIDEERIGYMPYYTLMEDNFIEDRDQLYQEFALCLFTQHLKEITETEAYLYNEIARAKGISDEIIEMSKRFGSMRITKENIEKRIKLAEKELAKIGAKK